MPFSFRRVVTGHDTEGKAIIKSDRVVNAEPRLPGYDASVVWCSSQFPPSNDEEDFDDGAPGPAGSRVLFRTAEFDPGFSVPSMHRTETQDVAVVISGQLDLVLDGGEVVESLQAGDFLIQRGTMHEWVPRGSKPVRVLYVLMDAPPARVGDLVLRDDLTSLDGAISPMPN